MNILSRSQVVLIETFALARGCSLSKKAQFAMIFLTSDTEKGPDSYESGPGVPAWELLK
jgi:hypothetical protein